VAFADGHVICEMVYDPINGDFICHQVDKLSVELADPNSIDQIVEWLRNKGIY